MQSTENRAQGVGGAAASPTLQPFAQQDGQYEGSSSSFTSDSAHGSTVLCSCGSLTGWSSLQLQEQHLLEPTNSTKSPQDMFVVVLTKEYEVSKPTGLGDKLKAHAPAAASNVEQPASLFSKLLQKVCCDQSPRQLTQELCLRLLALLILVLASVGLAYRLAKRRS